MILVLAFALAYVGFVALCLSMRRHRDQVREASRLPAGLLRWTGVVFLAGLTAVSVVQWGWGVGPVYAIIIASGAGLGFVVFFAFRPRGAVVAAAGPFLLSLILFAGSLAS